MTHGKEKPLKHPGHPTQHHRLDNALAAVLAGRRQDLSRFSDEAIWSAVRWHGIYPLLHARASQGKAGGLSPDLLAALDRYTKGFALMDSEFRRQAGHLFEVLSEAGLPCLVFKGFAIADLYYESSSLRHRVDVDLAIAEEHRADVIDTLGRAGYGLKGHEHPRVSVGQFLAIAPGPTMKPVKFDIHTRASNRAVFGDILEFDRAWQNRQAMTPLPQSCWAPGTVDLLLHSCAHRLAHGRNEAGRRLLWLYDIHLMMNTLAGADQGLLVSEALDRRVGGICADALGTVNGLFEAGIDADLIRELAANQDHEPSWSLVKSGKLAWYWSDLLGQKQLRDQVRFLGETLGNRLGRQS